MLNIMPMTTVIMLQFVYACRRGRVESSSTRSLLLDNIIVSPKMYSTVSTFIIQ